MPLGLPGVESHLFCQPRSYGHFGRTEKYSQINLLSASFFFFFYLLPSECTGNNIIYSMICIYLGFPSGSKVKYPPAMQEIWVLFPCGEDSPGRGHGNSLQHSWRKNPMDRGAWRAMVTGSQRVTHDCTN